MNIKRDVIIICCIVIFTIIALAVIRTNITGKVITSIDSCSDSDNGKNYWVAGHVEGYYHEPTKPQTPNFTNFYNEDECRDKNIVVEFYCEKGNFGMHSYEKSVEYNCPEGCSEGACKGEPIEVPEKKSFWKKLFGVFGF